MEKRKCRDRNSRSTRERKYEKFIAKINAINLPLLGCTHADVSKKYLLSESEEKIVNFKFYLHHNYAHHGYSWIKRLVSLAESNPAAPELQKFWDEIEEKRLRDTTVVDLINNDGFRKNKSTDSLLAYSPSASNISVKITEIVGPSSLTTSDCSSEVSSIEPEKVTNPDSIAVSERDAKVLPFTAKGMSLLPIIQHQSLFSNILNIERHRIDSLMSSSGVSVLPVPVSEPCLGSSQVEKASLNVLSFTKRAFSSSVSRFAPSLEPKLCSDLSDTQFLKCEGSSAQKVSIPASVTSVLMHIFDSNLKLHSGSVGQRIFDFNLKPFPEPGGLISTIQLTSLTSFIVSVYRRSVYDYLTRGWPSPKQIW